MNDVRARIIVSGMVQGVGFRYFVATHAEDLDVDGFVRNRSDGSVELEAEGERGHVEELLSRVRVGPRFAHVTGVEIVWQEPHHRNEPFTIL